MIIVPSNVSAKVPDPQTLTSSTFYQGSNYAAVTNTSFYIPYYDVPNGKYVLGVFDAESGNLSKKIQTGLGSGAIAVKADDSAVFQTSGNADLYGIFNLNNATPTIIPGQGYINNAGFINALVLNNSETKLYGVQYSDDRFYVINPTTIRGYNTPAGQIYMGVTPAYTIGARSMSISPDGSSLYIGGGQSYVMKYSTSNDSWSSNVYSNYGYFSNQQNGSSVIAFSSDGVYGYGCSSGSTTGVIKFNVASPSTQTFVQISSTGWDSGPITINPAAPRLYAATANGRTISIINTDTMSVIKTLSMSATITGLLCNKSGTRVLVICGEYVSFIV